MNNDEQMQYIGQVLLQRGFSDWFRFMFNKIENRPFTVDPIHNSLFDIFNKIVNMEENRVCLNLPPRSGKTTLAEYILAYGITLNPRSNFIYTSYSQSLLGDIANKVKDILNHPIYIKMYPSFNRVDELEEKPIDDFWLQYLEKTTGKSTFSSKKIVTAQGGVTLFSSIGASITGFGAGIRNNNDKFCGALIIDDPQKPADIRSQVMREKTKVYFQETLLSRLNNPNVPILCIMQRLHLDDLSGFLDNEYNFTIFKKPLLVNNVCQIPSQYTEERIKELQVNDYVFQAQYQQEPIQLGGSIIKTDWFDYYPLGKYDYNKVVIAADTAMSIKESADYTCFIVGGITPNGKLHILDLVHGRYEFPELKQQLVNLYNKYQYTDGITTSCSSVVVENKASGIQLIQELQTSTGIPITPVDVTKDKLTRVEETLNYFSSGNVLLPVNSSYGFNKIILNECAEFNREQTQLHDDVVDALVHLINNTIANRTITIFDNLDNYEKVFS